MSEPAVRIFGTDLFLGPALDEDMLRSILAAQFGVGAEDIIRWDEADRPDGFWGAYGERNVVRLHALPPDGNLRWKADLDFTAPIPIHRMQALAEALGGVVALARDTAFPADVGAAREGYVIFRPGAPPASGALRESGDEGDPGWDWVPTGDPLPALPL